MKPRLEGNLAAIHAQTGTEFSLLRSKSTLIYMLIAVPVIAVLLFVTVRPVLVLPRIRLAPGYLLVNQDGVRMSHEDLRGHIVLYNTAFTDCGETCTASWALMADLQREIGALNSEIPIDLVTISVDPADTPERLSAYAQANGVDTTRWHLLTGDPDQLKYIVGAGMTTYYTVEEDKVTLEPSMIIVDGVGILRAEYRRGVPSLSEAMRDIDLLLTEARNSTGITKYAYEAAHLFLCYP
ncbi:SCO family protein [bacterium]|nr:SCO family protein [bacterium]